MKISGVFGCGKAFCQSKLLNITYYRTNNDAIYDQVIFPSIKVVCMVGVANCSSFFLGQTFSWFSREYVSPEPGEQNPFTTWLEVLDVFLGGVPVMTYMGRSHMTKKFSIETMIMLFCLDRFYSLDAMVLRDVFCCFFRWEHPGVVLSLVLVVRWATV